MRTVLQRILLVLALAVGASVVPSATIAGASAAPGWDAGYIISDATFYDSTRMSADQIDAFLRAKGASCVSSASGIPCLKDYRETTTSRAATSYCAAYTGGANQSAAAIIADVARACGINPQSLIVTLQKEQALVTTTAPTARKYQIAMGYGCPDTAACDTQYYGFFNQIYSAASQFQRYRANPRNYGYVAGRNNTINYHPNAACGSSQVYIKNQATAGLYNYTPHQPNAAALATEYGNGDSCSSYGNRNFYNFFYNWFGNPTGQTPFGSVDQVTADGPWITVGGWALDPDTSDSIRVHVYVDGKGAANVLADGARPDIERIYGRGAAHGFNARVSVSDGVHDVCAFAIDSDGGTNTLMRCSTVTTRSASPSTSLDVARASGATIKVGGWAMSPHTQASIRTDLYLDGRGVTSRIADGERPDLQRIFGNGSTHGYDFEVTADPGQHQVCVYAINPFGSGHTYRCATVTVASQPARGSLDAVTTDGVMVTAGGWAMSPHTSSPIQVSVSLDGAGVATGVADGVRSDIARIFGNGDRHGYDLTFRSPPGTHRVCTSALDPYSTTGSSLGCRDIVVSAVAPTGVLDTVTVSPGAATLTGWAMSPHTSDPIRVDTYVDGRGAHSGMASEPRPDVERVYGNGAAHGYRTTLALAPGTHSICQFAIDPYAGNHALFACRDVVVP
ncbi:MAG: hypothetical protein J0H73_12155 [Salana multivorans]|nr:hypothetical protein [Salana multivorans]OJX98338.1 MAG: hypothetical protein BGO96_03915 [Micrococcales bacterium 73-15]